MAKVLFVMTGADQWTLADGTTHPTGFWAEEAVVPLEELRAAGHEVTVATPGGVLPPVDGASLSADANGGEEEAARLKAAVEGAEEFASPVPLAGVRPADFDAVFVPGGHGPMEDLAVDADAGRLLAEAVRSGKPVGVVCHGPAALLAAVTDDGTNAFAGYRVTAFSNTEEALAGSAHKAAWLLQDRLTEAGLRVEVGEPWAPHVVADRNVVTGQNPASSRPVAAALLEQLRWMSSTVTTAPAITWPERYLPGTTDNYVSNEVVVAGLTVADVWPLLVDTSAWATYYDNVSHLSFPEGGGPQLTDGLRFRFGTFGFPPLDAQVTEFVPPVEGRPARLSWTAKQDGSPDERLDVLHAWLLQDLPGGRVRVLTQESQIGRPAAELARQKPDPMLNGHQDWLDGIVATAAGRVRA